MKPVAFHPEAETEFASATEFYRAERPSLTREFAEEVNHAVEFVRKNTEAGSPIRGAIRRWRVRRFPYSILYREEATGFTFWPWHTSAAGPSTGVIERESRCAPPRFAHARRLTALQ